MRIDFYKLKPYVKLRWDITENGYSLLTRQPSIIFKADTKREGGLHVDPERAVDHVHLFPRIRTRSQVLFWLVRSGFFSPLQAITLLLFPTSGILRSFMYKRPGCFSGSLTAFVKKYRKDFSEYFRDSEKSDFTSWIEEIDPRKMPEDEVAQKQFFRRLEQKPDFPFKPVDSSD